MSEPEATCSGLGPPIGSVVPESTQRTRVLVAVEPRMYRQVIATSIDEHFPQVELRTAAADTLEDELASFRPHLIVGNELSEVIRAETPYWMEVLLGETLDANVRVDEHRSTIKNAGLQDLLATVQAAVEQASSG